MSQAKPHADAATTSGQPASDDYQRSKAEPSSASLLNLARLLGRLTARAYLAHTGSESVDAPAPSRQSKEDV